MTSQADIPGFTVVPLTVISSTKVNHKVTQVLAALYPGRFDEAQADTLAPNSNHVVALSAKGPVASKLVSVVEIVKRDALEYASKHAPENKTAGTLYQYSSLRGIAEPPKPKKASPKELSNVGENEPPDEADDDFYESFGQTPAGRALDLDQPKQRETPVLTIYLSRTSVGQLRDTYSEQVSN